MGSSHQNVKQIVNKLEKKGYVRVEEDTEDRRKLRISLTDYAKRTAERYQEKEEQFMGRLFEGVSEEQAAQLFYGLSKMEKNLIKMREMFTERKELL